MNWYNLQEGTGFDFWGWHRWGVGCRHSHPFQMLWFTLSNKYQTNDKNDKMVKIINTKTKIKVILQIYIVYEWEEKKSVMIKGDMHCG